MRRERETLRERHETFWQLKCQELRYHWKVEGLVMSCEAFLIFENIDEMIEESFLREVSQEMSAHRAM